MFAGISYWLLDMPALLLAPYTSNNEAPHVASNDVPERFFFFLPPPVGPFIAVESC